MSFNCKITNPSGTIRILSPKLVNHFNKSQAIFIHQLHYWIQKGSGVVHEGKRWIYNTSEEWADQIMVCERQARRIISSLKSLGVLQVQKLSRLKSDRTNYFTIDYDVLEKLLSSNQPSCSKAEETEGFSSSIVADKMSVSPGQNVRMVKQRILTKIEDDLIEEGVTQSNPKILDSRKEKLGSVEQVHQVDKFDHERKGNRTEEDKSNVIHKTTTAQDMLSIWNKHFPKSQAVMTKDLARYLVSTYKRLEANIDRWRHYCALIESSPYLTGETFSLSIQWAIKFSALDRILGGEFQVSKSLLVYIPTDEILSHKAEAHIQSLRDVERPEILHLRRLFLKKYGPAAYHSWFSHVRLSLSNGVVQIETDNAFVREKILTKFFNGQQSIGSCFFLSESHIMRGTFQNAA